MRHPCDCLGLVYPHLSPGGHSWGGRRRLQGLIAILYFPQPHHLPGWKEKKTVRLGRLFSAQGHRACPLLSRPPSHTQAVSTLGAPVLHTQRSWKHEWRPHHRRVCPARTAFFAREDCAHGAVACAPWKLPCSRAEASVISDLGFPPSSGAFKRFGPSAFLRVHVTPAGAPLDWLCQAHLGKGRRQGGRWGPGLAVACAVSSSSWSLAPVAPPLRTAGLRSRVLAPSYRKVRSVAALAGLWGPRPRRQARGFQLITHPSSRQD